MTLQKFYRDFIDRVRSYPSVRSVTEHIYRQPNGDLWSSIYVYYDGGYEVFRCDSVISYRIMVAL